MKKMVLALMALLSGAACDAQQTKYTTQNNAEFAATIADPAAQLVDVRTRGEFAAGHIPGAVNIDVNAPDFGDKIAKLDKKRPVAVYCRSGVRSRAAAAKLAEAGFQVYNLDGGIIGWDGKTVK